MPARSNQLARNPLVGRVMLGTFGNLTNHHNLPGHDCDVLLIYECLW